MSFKNKVVLITGASSGIGEEAAIYFSTLSAKLVLTGRNEENLKKITDTCHKNSGHLPLCISADISKDADVDKIIVSTKQHFGRLDVLINNAGIFLIDGIENLNMANYDQIMNINLRAVFYLTKLAIPLLKESKGNIVNITSTLGVRPMQQSLTYGVTKAAVDFFTRSIALELGPKKVRANSLAVGYVHASSSSHNSFVASTPLGEPVEINDVARMIAFVAGDSAKSITGQNLAIDAGFSAQ